MTKRSLLLLAPLAGLLLQPAGRAALPDCAADLKAQLATAKDLRLDLLYVDPDRAGGQGRLTIHADDTERIAIDQLGPDRRFTLDEGALWVSDASLDGPELLEVYEGILLDVWKELRSDGAVWQDRSPADYDLSVPAGAGWVEVELPFEWSEDLRLFLSFADDTDLQQIAVYLPGDPEPDLYLVQSLAFDLDPPAEAFDRAHDAYEIQFTHDETYRIPPGEPAENAVDLIAVEL